MHLSLSYEVLLEMFDLLRSRDTSYTYNIEWDDLYRQHSDDIIIAVAYKYSTDKVMLVATPI